MKNPFRYGAKVTGGAFYDRREIKALSTGNISYWTRSLRIIVELRALNTLIGVQWRFQVSGWGEGFWLRLGI